MIRTYNHALRVQVFGALSTIDYGDAPTAPGYVEQTLAADGGVRGARSPSRARVPVGIGGDHSSRSPSCARWRSVHGPLGLVHLDAHTDLWDTYNGLPYAHGTMFRRAIEEGVLEPARMIQLGMRGPLYGEDDEAIPATLGVETIGWLELAELTPARCCERVRARIGDGPAFCTFDVDFVDPAFAPGTGTPEVGGPTSHQALQFCARAGAGARSSATTSSRSRRSTTARAR